MGRGLIRGNGRELESEETIFNNNKMKFIGRCGSYVYFDMHQAISAGLNTAREYIKENK